MNCPICEHKIEVTEKTKIGERITCLNCFAQLGLFKHKGKLVLACAMCKDPVFNPDNCGECERRRESKALLEEGRL